MAWVKPKEIIGRRTKEHDLFVTGKYANHGMATIFPATPEGKVLWNKGTRINLAGEINHTTIGA